MVIECEGEEIENKTKTLQTDPRLTSRTVRSAKVPAIQERYKAYGTEVEIVGVDDIVAGSFKDALKGEFSRLVNMRVPIEVFYCLSQVSMP